MGVFLKTLPFVFMKKAVAQLTTKSRRYDHITNIFIQQHWLPRTQRIHCKIALITFKVPPCLAPPTVRV